MRRLLFVLHLTIATACSGGGSLSCGFGADFTSGEGARRFDFRGRVISVARADRQATVAHERIDGFMDPMTMPFTVKEGWALQVMKPGDLVQGTLVVDGSRSWIEVAAVTSDPRGAAEPNEPKGTGVPAEPGTPVPELTLVDQDRRTFKLNRYKGAPLLVTFAYTRCPLPEYCPLVMQRFAALERATAGDPRLARVRLLTVTLDPAHDTPARLREYGLHYTAGGHAPGKDGDSFTRWQLATGNPEEIKRLAAFFGLDYYGETSTQVIHSLRTGVIDGEGKVARVFENNDWKIDDVLAVLHGLP
jgi:protein SCO1/2